MNISLTTATPLNHAQPMMRNALTLIVLWLVCLSQAYAKSTPTEPMIVTHIGVSNIDDERTTYQIELIDLSFEKTRDEYGDYRLEPAPSDMTQARAVQSLRENLYKNYIYILGFNSDLAHDDSIDYVRFPTVLGVVGYRICFTSPSAEEAFNKVEKLDDIRQFEHGQGVAWADVKILRHNQFRVREIGNYASLFRMTAADRLDVFCRGLNEVYSEHRLIDQYPGLKFDRKVALYYPLPMLFFSHKSNTKVLNRMHLGLQRAYEDGSLIRLWTKHFRNSIEFVEMDKRKVFFLENPSIKHIDFDYQRYLYAPLRAFDPPQKNDLSAQIKQEPLP